MKLSKIKDGDVVVYGGEEFAVIRDNGSNLEGVPESDLLYIDLADDWGEEERLYLFQCLDDDGHLKDFTKPEKHRVKMKITMRDLTFLESAMSIIMDDEDEEGALAGKWCEVFRGMKQHVQDDGA